MNRLRTATGASDLDDLSIPSFAFPTSGAFPLQSKRASAGTVHRTTTPYMDTSSYESGVDSLPMELSELGAHADHCKRAQGPMFAIRSAFDVIHGFVAPRMITTLVVFGFLIGIGSLIA